MRAAVLTTSPATMPSPSSGRASSVASTSPVLTPIRTLRSSSGLSWFNPSIAARIRRAAWIARCGSSSWAVGAPKTAMTASPMNFSTVPPCHSICLRSSWWYGRIRARTSSGSARSEAAVKPIKSQKRTDTTLRSSRAPGPCRPNGARQYGQNGNWPGSSLPQLLQITQPSPRRASSPTSTRLYGRGDRGVKIGFPPPISWRGEIPNSFADFNLCKENYRLTSQSNISKVRGLHYCESRYCLYVS